ncbi:YhcH/YjgK/YiaL family protein [Clostridium carnis]
MIIDKVNNLSSYCVTENMKRAVAFMNDHDFDKDELGVHKIDGENFYYVVSEYETKNKEDGAYEAHKKYIDIQYMKSGEERIYYNNVKDLEVVTEYNEENDFYMLKGEDNGSILLAEEYAAVYFPEDGHMPGISNIETKKIRKVIVKVLV